MSSASVIEFGTFNPRQNLPVEVARKRGESNFVAAFQRGFTVQREGQGVGGRHFELAGYGIADFVWMDFGRGGKRAGGVVGGACSDGLRNEAEGLAEGTFTGVPVQLFLGPRRRGSFLRMSRIEPKCICMCSSGLALGCGVTNRNPRKIDMRFTPIATKAKNPIARERALNRFSHKLKFRKTRE